MAALSVVTVQRAFRAKNEKKSTGTAAKELSMSKTTVWKVLRERLVFSYNTFL
jgi:response regulator of citrate/malate metabolism